MAKAKSTGPARKTRIRPVTQDRNPKRQHNKRAEENKAIRREALREQLQAKEYLRQIQLVDDELKELNSELKALGIDKRTKSPEKIKEQLTRHDLTINKAETRVKVLNGLIKCFLISGPLSCQTRMVTRRFPHSSMR